LKNVKWARRQGGTPPRRHHRRHHRSIHHHYRLQQHRQHHQAPLLLSASLAQSTVFVCTFVSVTRVPVQTNINHAKIPLFFSIFPSPSAFNSKVDAVPLVLSDVTRVFSRSCLHWQILKAWDLRLKEDCSRIAHKIGKEGTPSQERPLLPFVATLLSSLCRATHLWSSAQPDESFEFIIFNVGEKSR
jgi:hypothetical protein